VWDWSTLLFNRHGDFGAWDRSRVWQEGTFAGGELPIVENTALSFINTGSDLIHAAGELYRLHGESRALQWASHLLSRYDQVRHPQTGLGAYQFNHRDPCRVRESFKTPLGERPDVNEATVLTSGTITTRGQRAAVTFLNLYDQLGDDDGRPFLEVTLKDLRALAEHSWDAEQGYFHPVLYDGRRLREADAEERGYCPPSKLVTVPASGGALLSYARAYRLCGDDDLLQMSAAIAGAMGWSGAGTAVPTPEDGASVSDGPAAVFALLDLHEATGETDYLESATQLGRSLAAQRQSGDMLASNPSAAGAASNDNVLALALLHCAAAAGGHRRDMPPYYPGSNPWDPKIIVRTVLGRR
jgi:pectate lyase